MGSNSSVQDNEYRQQRADISSCSFLESSAFGDGGTGGAIYACEDSALFITESELMGNKAAWRAGAIMAFHGVNMKISYTRFQHNQLMDDPDELEWNRYGAAIAVDGGNGLDGDASVTSATVIHSYIGNNSCTKCSGGAIEGIRHAIMIVRNTVIDDNKASEAGAIKVKHWSSLTMTGGALHNNVASTLGGAILTYVSATVELDGVIITGNSAAAMGGFINVKGVPEVEDGIIKQPGGASMVIMKNCTISQNTAGDLGGAVFIFGDNVQMYNCILEDNAARNGSGGAIYVGANSTFTMKDSELRRNHAAEDGGGFCFDGTLYSDNGDLQTYSYPEDPASYPIQANILKTSIADNSAGVRGGGIYSTNYAVLHVEDMTSSRNTALALAPAVYLSSNSKATLVRTVFENEQVNTGPIIFVGRVSTMSARDLVLSNDITTPLPLSALQLLRFSRFSCERCTFANWASSAAQIIASAGQLKLDAPDFTSSTSRRLINSTGGAQVKNAVVAASNYASARTTAAASSGSMNTQDLSLAQGVATCEDMPSLCGPAEHCVNGGIGVYCVAGMHSLPVLSLTADKPETQYYPSHRSAVLHLELTCSTKSGAADEPVVWIITADSDEQGWVAMPPSGILRCSDGTQRRHELGAYAALAGTGVIGDAPGTPSIDINVTGLPNGGTITANFTVWAWVQSETVPVATVSFQSSYWFCQSGLYWEESRCLACADILGGGKGLDCATDGAADKGLPVHSGYWMPHAAYGKERRVLECQSAAVCLGGLQNECHSG
eukprot:TRINITY_DN323_c0_g2_i2.p1 TRINITY_DN323_c0_g2~~TRINITY_DN323_c0_g2_i2.p1  ORF type:complete len:779 (-),score=181.90 TRINITY_DN323_c0_g2_i2:6191-8527(-)